MADELYFIGVAPEDDPTAVVRELVEGGATKRVTEENKRLFLDVILALIRGIKWLVSGDISPLTLIYRLIMCAAFQWSTCL